MTACLSFPTIPTTIPTTHYDGSEGASFKLSIAKFVLKRFLNKKWGTYISQSEDQISGVY